MPIVGMTADYLHENIGRPHRLCGQTSGGYMYEVIVNSSMPITECMARTLAKELDIPGGLHNKRAYVVEDDDLGNLSSCWAVCRVDSWYRLLLMSYTLTVEGGANDD